MSPDTPRLAPARRGYSLSYQGIQLLSSVDPQSQAEKYYSNCELSPSTVFVIPSPLLAYGLQTLLNRLDEKSLILAIEADSQLTACSLQHIPQELLTHPQFIFFHNTKISNICAHLRQEYGPRAFRRITELKTGLGWTLNKGYYEEFITTLREELALNWTNTLTLTRLGRRYAQNAIRNIPLLAQSAPQLSLYKQAALVCGAGPSLDACLENLTQTAPQLLRKESPLAIICVDTALNALSSRSIPIDIAVALEAQHWNMKDFTGQRDAAKHLAMDVSAVPAGARAMRAHLHLFYTRWTEMCFLDRLEQSGLISDTLTPLGSVGLTALNLALNCIPGPIFFCGLDFAYDIDAWHARSTPSHITSLNTASRLSGLCHPESWTRSGVKKITGKNAKPLLSDPSLLSYNALLSREFMHQHRVYDISSWGAANAIQQCEIPEMLRLIKDYHRATTENESQAMKQNSIEHRLIRAKDFLLEEQSKLQRLIDILSGQTPSQDYEGTSELDILLDYCDYLWAHFPDCAGNDGKRTSTSNLSFLKRVRAEADVFMKTFTIALQEFKNV